MSFDPASRLKSINRRATLLAVANLLLWAAVIAGLAWARH